MDDTSSNDQEDFKHLSDHDDYLEKVDEEDMLEPVEQGDSSYVTEFDERPEWSESETKSEDVHSNQVSLKKAIQFIFSELIRKDCDTGLY